jgi:hypothetical protein
MGVGRSGYGMLGKNVLCQLLMGKESCVNMAKVNVQEAAAGQLHLLKSLFQDKILKTRKGSKVQVPPN